MYVSSLCVVFACAALAFEVGHGWSWGLFVWGLAVGAAAILGYEALLKLIPKVFHISGAEVANARRQLKARKQAIYPLFGAYGVAVGILAAGLGKIWPDLVWTAMVVVSEVGVPVVAYLFVKRRVELVKHDSGAIEGTSTR